MRNRWHKAWGKQKGFDRGFGNFTKTRESKQISYGVQIQREKEDIFEKFVKGFKESLKTLSKEEKFQKLKHISENYKFNCAVSYEARRRFHKEYRGQWFQEWKNCFICKDSKVEHIHHIVMLNNGGTNDESNLMGICKECHKHIHSWMN